jgi:uncharacterized membrane protein YkoI
MKTPILVIVSALFISLNAFAQNPKDLPSKVKTSFDQKFPGARNTKWNKENAKEWEVEFTMNNKDYSASFSPDGNWLETEYKISETEIPAVVTSALGKEFPGYKIGISEISETSKGKVYEFDIISGKVKKEVSINADGTLVKK